MDHLSAALKKGGVKDLLAFFPPNKREVKHLEEHFRKAGLPQVADWWAKKQYAVVKESIIKELTDALEREESPEQVKRKRGLLYLLLLTNYLGHFCHQSSPGRVAYPRGRIGAMHLAGPHGFS